MAGFPKNLELFFRSFLCCLCCGLEATAHSPNSNCNYPTVGNSSYYKSNAFLTIEDVLKLLVPLLFSLFSFACVILYFFYPLYVDKLVFAQLSFLAFLCLVSSTYVCRYIYTFHTNVAKQNILLVTAKYTCLQKWLSLCLVVFSSFIFLVDLWAYTNPYGHTSPLTATATPYKNPMLTRCSSIQVLFWETFSIFWSTIWYVLVLKSATYLRKRQHIIRALEIRTDASRSLFLEGTLNGIPINRNDLANCINNRLYINGTVYKEENLENVDYAKLQAERSSAPVFESRIAQQNTNELNGVHPITIGIPVNLRIEEMRMNAYNNNNNTSNNNNNYPNNAREPEPNILV